MGKRTVLILLAAWLCGAAGCRRPNARRAISPERRVTLAVRVEAGVRLTVSRLGAAQREAGRFEDVLADGFWIDVGLPRGDYRVRATRAGFAAASRDLTCWAGPYEVVLALAPEAPLAGEVTVADEPLSDAIVSAVQGDERFATRSDSQGRFALSGLAAGPATISMEKPGFVPVTREVLAPSDGLALRTRRLHRLWGAARAAAGRVAGAVVRVGGSGLWPPRDVAVDERGEYSVELPEGVYEIRALAPGLASLGLASVDLGDGGVRRDLDLLPAASLRGRLRAEDGSPVAGATVALSGAAALDVDRSTKTDAAGEFLLAPLPGGTYAISVAAIGFLPFVGEAVDLTPPQDARIDATLTKGATLRGEIVDDGGRPVPGAGIELEGRGPDGRIRSVLNTAKAVAPLIPRGELGVVPGRVPWPSEAAGAGVALVTEASGAFVADGLPAGVLTLRVAHADFVEANAEVTLELGRTSTVRLVLLRGAEIAGRIFDDGGFPLADVRVRARRSDGAERGVMTGPSGDYLLTGISGRVEIEAERPGFVPARLTVDVEERARMDRIDIALVAANLALEGRLLDEGGVPVAGARVRVRPLRGPVREAQSDAHGLFEVTALPPGLAAVEVIPVALPPLRTSVMAEQGEPLDLTLPYGGGIDGFVRDARTREPVAEFSASCGRLSATGRDGEFALLAAPAGSCTLEVSAPGYATYRQPIDVVPGGAPGEVTVRDVWIDLEAQ